MVSTQTEEDMTDAFDTMFPRRPAMTAAQAREVVAEMMRDTPRPARERLIKTALKIGNLTDDAKAVYRAALNA
jgi:polyhydroxyalkanoate synthesis regulator phasin